jgi:hypothetical protein
MRVGSGTNSAALEVAAVVAHDREEERWRLGLAEEEK